MKSSLAAERSLRATLESSPVFAVLLAGEPVGESFAAAQYDGAAPVVVERFDISGRFAKNAAPIYFQPNTGRTSARVSAWALTDGSGWIYAGRFPEPFDVRPGDEPYFSAADLVIEE